MTRLVMILVLSLTLTACATVRSINPIVFQGSGFDQARYQADLTDCYRMIDEQAAAVNTADTVGAKAMTGGIIGATAGAILGGVVGTPGRGAALGAAIGGTAGGLAGYSASEREKRAIYYQAVKTCLALKGYEVLGATGALQ